MNKTMRIEQGNYEVLKDGSIKVILPEDELARSNSNTSSIKTIEEIEREEDERYEFLYQLSQKLPKGVKPEDVENVEAYPHYIPKGFNVENIKYSETTELYYLQQEGYCLTYVPIHQLDEAIERFENLFDESYIIWRWNQKYPWSKHVPRAKIENELARCQRLHDTFIKALSSRPLIKGVWICTFYPTMDKKYKKIKLWLQKGNNRICCFDKKMVKKQIEKLMPENGSCVILKTLYYSMIAVYLEMMFRLVESGKDDFNRYQLSQGINNPYMEFLMGNESEYRQLLQRYEFAPWYNCVCWSEEGGIKKRIAQPGSWTPPGYYTGIEESDFELCQAYAEELLPIGGWFEILVQDDLESKSRPPISIVRRPSNFKYLNNKGYLYGQLHFLEDQPRGKEMSLIRRRTTIVMLQEPERGQ